LAIDLDFTLLNRERAISEENRAAVRRAGEAGIAVVLASGRGTAGMRPFAHALELDGLMVTCNGALVATRDGSIIEEHLLEPERLSKVIDFAKAGEHHLHLYCREEVLMPAHTEWAEIYVHKAKQHPPRAVGWEGMAQATPNKAIIVTSPETVLAIEPAARTLFEEEGAVLLSEPEYLEFVCPWASKATGLSAAADSLGILQANTAAIGDYYNDLPMIQWAAHSAAVQNARPEVIDAADIVVASHEENGVAEYIDLLIRDLGQWNAGSIVYNRG
jgi:Cof subfamily protein (haloacid dehalogenase superfamily)